MSADSLFLQRMRALAETELSSERLVLEPLQAEHAPRLFAGLSDPSLYRFIPQDPPEDLAALTARFERIARRGGARGDEVWLNWAIRKRDGDYCGQFEATAAAGGLVDIAYFIFTPMQGSGIATEAGTAAIAALRSGGARRIGASLDTRNLASAALVERLGLGLIATVVAADFFKGASSDEFRYELAYQGDAS